MNVELNDFYKHFNQTQADYPKDKTIIDLFLEQVKKTPDADAVVFQEQSMTYQELDEESNKITAYLKKMNIGTEDIIGIALERSFEMITGIYGILKSGAAYLPILPDTPINRIQYIVNDSKMKYLFTQSKFVKKFSEDLDVEVIDINQLSLVNEIKMELTDLPKPQNLMYVIYTSGSTGQPKGVMIEHYSVVNRINWMQKNYPIEKGDTILQKTSFAFDVSVWELFWWAITGARVCMLQSGFEKFPLAIINEINQNNITTIHFVPSMLSTFLYYMQENIDSISLPSLKRVFCSGEALLPMHVKKFNRLIGNKFNVDLINLYGPTETTVDITYYNCPKDDKIDSVPIGKPIDNIRLYVIKDGELQGPSGEGELLVAGLGLARGYLHKEKLTADKYKVYPELFNERLYSTGDYVRFTENKEIEYIGRIDGQIKLRGLRIELGEIEHHINQFPSVEQGIVVVKNAESTNACLVAYLVVSSEINQKELKVYLKKYLPSYMVPNRFVVLDSFPLSQNGKVDRIKLRDSY